MTTSYPTALERAIKAKAQLYNRKSNIPDEKRGDELYYLYTLAGQAPIGMAVEVGVREGGSVVCWAAAREDRGQVVCVDIRELRTLRPNLERYGIVADYHMQGSLQAAQDLPNGLAFVFIDADHGYPIFDDVAAWPQKLMVGGIIVFHDYATQKGMVKEAVDEWAQGSENYMCLGRVGSTIAFKRLE